MIRPRVGSEVTVVVRNISACKPVFVPLWNDWTASSPQTYRYTGTVVKPDYWMRTDEFNLTTGEADFPVRTIDLKNVVSIDDVNVDGKSASQVTSKIIKGSKGNEYVVTLNNGVAETCTCPAFLYRGGRCKHLAIASA